MVSRITRVGGSLLLAAIPALLFLPVCQYSFVTLDDGVHVYANSILRSFSWESFVRLWKMPFQGLYVPISYLGWWVQYALTQLLISSPGNVLDPWIFHSVNLLLHVLNALLVFTIVRKFFKHWPSAAMGALVFAIHPLQVEAVAWISAFRDLLCAFFSLSALCLCLELPLDWANSERKRWRYFLASITFLLALLSKPAAVTVPLLALVLMWLKGEIRWKDRMLIVVPWIVLSLPILVLTKLAQPDFNIESVVPLIWRPLVVLDSLVFYVSKLLFPVFLSVNYGRTPEAAIQSPLLYWIWTVPLLIPFLLRRTSHARQWVGSGLIFVIYLLPVLGIVPFYFQKYSTVADRFAYLSMVGVALLFACCFENTKKVVGRVLLVSYLVLLAILTHGQLRHWKSNEALLTRISAVNPNVEVFYTLGVHFGERGSHEKAIKNYRKALAMDPRHAPSHNNLGLIYFQEGRIQEAERGFRNAASIAPYLTEGHNNLGALLLGTGREEEAIKQFEWAIKLNPAGADAYFNLGTVYERRGKLDVAAKYYQESVSLRPDNQRFRSVLAAIQAKKGRG